MKHCGMDWNNLIDTVYLSEIKFNHIKERLVDKKIIIDNSYKLNQYLTFENCLIIFTDQGQMDITNGMLRCIDCEIMIDDSIVDGCITSETIKTVCLFNTLIMNAQYFSDYQSIKLHLFDSVLYFNDNSNIFAKMVYLYHTKIIFKDEIFNKNLTGFHYEQILRESEYKVTDSDIMIIDGKGQMLLNLYIFDKLSLNNTLDSFQNHFEFLLDEQYIKNIYNKHHYEEKMFKQQKRTS